MKKTLRKEKIRVLESLSAKEKEAADNGIIENVTSLPEYKNAGSVFMFYGTDWEVDTRPLILDALSQGKRVALPLCLKDGIMEAREIRSLGELVPGPFKEIPEPGKAAPKMEKEEIDFALVPCVCADRKLCRLGRGGGYYDRFLKGRTFFAAAVCKSVVLADALSVEDFDERVDCVVTEEEVVRQ